jgi:glycosyltransferase involved in cell wall biosynthesis
MPVFNGESFLENRLKNILEQTFFDFDLIISNNASTDNTEKICKQFANKDNRIKYFNQQKNYGVERNFYFVLNKSNSPYFVWAGVDDIWEKDFLKETLNFLELEKKFVGCIGEVETYGEVKNREVSNKKISDLIKRIRLGEYGPQEATGEYEQKVKTYLNRNSAQALYGVFRTGSLKKSYIQKLFLGVDLAIILNFLKYGDYHVIKKKFIKFNIGGFSSKGITTSTKKLGHTWTGRLFPYYPFTKWCFENIGVKIFLKNIFHFIKLNITGELAIIYDILVLKK